MPLFDSFGNVTYGDTSQTRYLFTSREFDAATDLQYNRARWYDTGVGRWISEDPIGYVAGDDSLPARLLWVAAGLEGRPSIAKGESPWYTDPTETGALEGR